MRRVSLSWIAGLLSLATLFARPAWAAPDPAHDLDARVREVFAAMGAGKCDPEGLRAIAGDPGFKELPSVIKSVTYATLVTCVGGASTEEWLNLATAEPDAPPFVWSLQFVEHVSLSRYDDALADLETAARLSGATGQPLGLERDDAVFHVRQKLQADLPRQRRFLSALDAGRWTPQDMTQNPSSYWLDLSLMLMEAGQEREAARVARKVTKAADLFGMRLDKRFATLVSTDPSLFDIEYAAFAELERQRKLQDQATTDNGVYEIIDALRTLGRFDEALALADRTLLKAQIVDSQGKDYRNWIEDRRAYVLLNMGRFDEAIAAERVAATRLESGHANVSQVINLAEMLIGQGKFRDALDLLPPMDKPGLTSPLGAAFVAEIRVCAYNGLGDEKAEREALAITQTHVGDNRPARLRALLCANDIEGASAHMIGWLKDPMHREDALVELSPAPDMPLGPFDAILSKRFATVRRDPAVLAAVAQVGHTERLSRIGGIWPSYPGS